jgi:hypothetical protein
LAPILCYGECSSGVTPDVQAAADFDAAKAMTVCESEIRLPFNISDVIDNLRRENHVKQSEPRERKARPACANPQHLLFCEGTLARLDSPLHAKSLF